MSIELKNKKVSIIGAKRSGIATADAVKSLGGIPFVSDNNSIKDEQSIAHFEKNGIQYEFGQHSTMIYDCDLMVVSPGVAANSEVVIKAKSKKITVLPEIELAFHLCKSKIIGITGSNGKTTTTALIGEIFKNAGLPTFACGNIGNPFIAIARDIPENGFAVVELSSFQLELTDKFCPHVAVFLNLTPDHLDRHGKLETYINAKMKIFANQGSDDYSILNLDDKTLIDRCSSLKSKTIWFSTAKSLPDGIWAVPGGGIFVENQELMKADKMKIKGEHNLSNACAAISAALCVGISKNIIAEILKTFPGVEHRLEPVRLIGGVSFINDSKGTNIDSVYWALKAVSTPVILIAGGKDKAGDFTALNGLISAKVKAVIVIGQAAAKISSAWDKLTKCIPANTMDDAVNAAFANAVSGDTVLLSPGCASFDMFDNYEHRGRIFKQAVANLAAKVAHQ